MQETVSARGVRRSDRVVSVVIFCILAAIALAIYLTGRRSAPLPATAPEGRRAELLQPAEKLLESHTVRRVLSFDAENLYEYINGQAPRYVQFGFKALVVAEYESSDPSTRLVVDIYDMATRRNAYGIFADGRSPETAKVKVGNEGFASGNMVAFWKGRFYLKVSAPTEADVAALVLRAANEVAKWIEDDVGELPEFSTFPREGLVEDSLMFSKTDAFGLAHLRDAFVGQYDVEGSAYRLFFCDLGTEREALQALDDHEKFLVENNGTVEEKRVLDGAGVLWGGDKYFGPTLLISRGRFVAGCFGLADRTQAESLTEALLVRAREILDSHEPD